MKLSGAQRRPMEKDREKLRVARVERKRPRRRREKDLIRMCCWAVGVKTEGWWLRTWARRRGRWELRIVKV